MPPFLCTLWEDDQIAGDLYDRFDHRPLEVISQEQGLDFGRYEYDIRCGKCHVVGTVTDKSKAFTGLSPVDPASGLLDMSENLGAGHAAVHRYRRGTRRVDRLFANPRQAGEKSPIFPTPNFSRRCG